MRQGLTQLEVANAAFGYEISHCKVSRIERMQMPLVDAHCIDRLARALRVPRAELVAIDPKFAGRAAVAHLATTKGLWQHPARTI